MAAVTQANATPTDASAFYSKNVANLIEIMVDRGDDGVTLKDLDADEITEAAQVRPAAADNG